MPDFDPARWPSYGAYLRSKNIQARPGGWSEATRDQVTEGRDSAGLRFKSTRDQMGNDTVQHGQDQQSVHIRQPIVRAMVSASTGQVVV